MAKLTCNHNGIAVVLNRDEGRIDSRIIASVLGIEHESFLQTLERYQSVLSELGIFLFQTGKMKGRGRPFKYVMLNEDQFIFAVTLSRNTPQAIQAKKAVVLAFKKARELASTHTKEYLPLFHLAHDAAKAMSQDALNSGSDTDESIFHINVEKMINKAFGISAGQRDGLPQHVKTAISTAYQITYQAINQSLAAGMGYKSAYQEAKYRVNEFVRLFGQSGLGAAA